MATQSQIDANRRNAQKSTGPKTQEGKAKSRRNALRHGLTAKACMLADEDPNDLLDMIAEINEKFDPQDTDEDFLVQRMAEARIRYNRIMPLEASIFNLRLVVDKAPDPLMEAQGLSCQRAWAYMRDANGGNALSKLSRYETSLLREYDRSRHELEKLQKIRTAKPNPPPIVEKLRKEPDPPITPIESAQPTPRKPAPHKPAPRKPAPGTQPSQPSEAPTPEPLL